MENSPKPGRPLTAFNAIAVCFDTFASAWHTQNVLPTAQLPQYNDVQGYAVISNLLDGDKHPGMPSFLISPSTSPGIRPDSFASCAGIPDEIGDASQEFKKQNQQSWRLAKKFALSFKYQFTDQIEKQPTPPTDASPPELTFPPNPVTFVWAVGFDPSRTHAIVYIGMLCGVDCGGGACHLPVKQTNVWTEVQYSPVCQWMSFVTVPSASRRLC